MTRKAYLSQILVESELRATSLNIKRYVPQSEDDEETRIKLYVLLERCLYTAKQQSLATTHSVAAFNTVCAIVDQCSSSNIGCVNNLLFTTVGNDPSTSLFWQCFDLYFTQAGHARPKSSKQLLSSLSTTLRRFDSVEAVYFAKAQLVQHIELILVRGEDDSNLKPCLHMLSHFLQKGILSLDEINVGQLHHKQAAPIQNSTNMVKHGDLLGLLMRLAMKSDLASSIGQLLAIVLHLLSQPEAILQPSQEVDQPVWAVPLIQVFRHLPDNVDKLKRYIFPVLFRHDISNLAKFLTLLGFNTGSLQSLPHVEKDLLHAVLVSANEMGLLTLTERPSLFASTAFVEVTYRQVNDMLSDHGTSARLCGLSLLIASQAVTKPFERPALTLLRRHLHHIHADTDADFRGELIGLTSRLFDRLRAVTIVLARNNTTNRSGATREHDGTCVTALSEHTQFIRWYLRFIRWELRPSAAYQRHICALRCLSIVVRSGLDDRMEKNRLSKSAQAGTKWPFTCHALDTPSAELVLDLAMNPFDDVRQAAAACLDAYSNVISLDAGGEDLSKTMKVVLQRSEQLMLASGRADHADGVAHMYAILSARKAPSQFGGTQRHYVGTLLYKLETSLKIARSDLASAVQHHPIHGVLTSIRYIFEGKHSSGEVLQQAAKILIPLLREVWSVVKPVLCNDAPEGYLPDDFGDMASVTTKDTLSFCWRALKEASLLTGSLITMVPKANSDDTAKAATRKTLGDLTFAQLSELRHRGAFSTVAQTWVLCCIQCRSLTGSDSQSLIDGWFEDTIALLQDRITINTRRSAGLPSLMCGLLVGSSDRTLFVKAMTMLEDISRKAVDSSSAKGGSLPQVHAMNCVKDIVKHSRLADQSEQYVPTALALAADSLRSDAWAIRNCGLMLFRAVIDRLLGTNDSFEADHSFSNRTLDLEQHPQLLQIITKLLVIDESSQSQNAAANESVFLALQLLQRARIPASAMLDVQVAVLHLTASKSWHVRDKASRTYASLDSQRNPAEELRFLLSLGSTSRQNALHGLLLCSLYILRSTRFLQNRTGSLLGENLDTTSWSDEVQQQCAQTVRKHVHLYLRNDCDFTRAAYVDILTATKAFGDHICGPGAKQTSGPRHNEHDEHACSQVDISTELRSALHTTDRPTMNTLSMKLAAAAAQQYQEGIGKAMEIVEHVSHMARSDPDACTVFLDRLENSASGGCIEIMHLCTRLAHEDYPVLVRTAACKAMIRMLSGRPSEQRVNQSAQLNTQALREISTMCVDVKSNPELADSLLELRALYVDLAAELDIHNLDADQVNGWLKWCEHAIRGESMFTREAVSRSITHLSGCAMSTLVRTERRIGQFLRFCLLICDMLNDDDEDIRMSASAAACRLISAAANTSIEITDMTPLLASEALLRLMVNTTHYPHKLAQVAAARAFGNMDAVGPQILAAADTESVLFAEEKQNLYVDVAREVKAWSQVLLRLQPALLPKPLLKCLAHWTLNGLNELVAGVSTQSGAMGLSAKEDTFVLGLQLIHGAEIVLHCSTGGVRVPVKPSDLMLALHRLERSKSNLLWRWEAERVLASAVISRLSRIGAAAELHETAN